MSVLDQGIDKLERTLLTMPTPKSAPELLLHLRGLRRVRGAAAALEAVAAAGPSPTLTAPASAWPPLTAGLSQQGFRSFCFPAAPGCCRNWWRRILAAPGRLGAR